MKDEGSGEEEEEDDDDDDDDDEEECDNDTGLLCERTRASKRMSLSESRQEPD